MYRKHFALTAFPFDLVLEPEALFASSTITEAEARLKHLLELRAIGLVTGEAGSGKTTVCRKIASNLHPGLYRVFYVPLSTGNVMDMYKSIGWELGLPTERNRASAFRVIRADEGFGNRLLQCFAQHFDAKYLRGLRRVTLQSTRRLHDQPFAHPLDGIAHRNRENRSATAARGDHHAADRFGGDQWPRGVVDRDEGHVRGERGEPGHHRILALGAADRRR